MAIDSATTADMSTQRHCVRCHRPLDAQVAFLLGGERRCLRCTRRARLASAADLSGPALLCELGCPQQQPHCGRLAKPIPLCKRAYGTAFDSAVR